MGGIITRMVETIKQKDYGAVMTEDNNINGYYLVRWASKPYTSQEDMDEWAVGELVVHATYLNPVGRSRNWYTQGKDIMILRVQHVGLIYRKHPIKSNCLQHTIKLKP